MEGYVTLGELAPRLHMDKSNARRYVLRCGFTFQKFRTLGSGGQVENALTIEDAEAVIERRSSDGFLDNRLMSGNGNGYFYIARLLPELDPTRFKLGYTINLEGRLAAHRTVAPSTELVKAWPCKSTWEFAALDCLGQEGANIANEVYTFKDLGALLSRAEQFFALMPTCV